MPLCIIRVRVWKLLPLYGREPPCCVGLLLLLYLSPAEGHSGCFRFLMVMNKAAVNTPTQVCVGTHIASVDCWVAGAYGSQRSSGEAVLRAG